jgi:hypothetical protein
MSLDRSASALARWTGLDHLFVIALLSERTPRLRRFSESLAEQIDGWHESQADDEKSMLFGRWVAGNSTDCPAEELLGSLGLAVRPSTDASFTRTTAYAAMTAAIVLDQRSQGCTAADLEERWDLANIAGIEEAWRDTALWLLSGHRGIFQLPNFYHHLLERCDASLDDVSAAKKALEQARSQVYELLDRLKYCSPLGPLAHGVRRARGNAATSMVGQATIRTLEAAGLSSVQEVSELEVEDLIALGVQPRFAGQIHSYLRRRQR